MLNPIFTTLEQIQTTNICNSKTASHASSLLLSISQCCFILGLLLASDVLKQLANLSKYLQTSNIEFNEAFTYIDSIIKRIQSKLDSPDEYFSEIYQQASDICIEFNIEMKKPRIVGKQSTRNNVPAESTEIYFRKAIMIPFLDHVINNLNETFNDKNQKAFKLNNILAENIIGISNENLKTLIEEINEFYKQDLEDTFEDELLMWKEKWETCLTEISKKAIDN